MAEWQLLHSVEEAEEQLRSLGVLANLQGANAFLFNIVTRCLYEMREAGWQTVPQVCADAQWFITQCGELAFGAIAMFDPDSMTIFFNPEAEYWKSAEAAEANLQLGREERYWSTDRVEQPVWHEYGHFLHFLRSPQQYQQAEKWEVEIERKAALKVSRYAAESPGEFIAETFAGMAAGIGYDEEVQTIYRRYGGPLSCS